LLSRAGIASRRAAETLSAEGRVSVNGKVVTELGAKADPRNDKILVNNKPLVISDAAPTVVLLHKPRGYVSTKSDPQGRPTVLDLMPKKLQHLNPVGRLDFDTSGVLLLTDDGDLLHLLTHPSHGVEKVYHARVGGKVLPDTTKKLEAGIYIQEDDQHIKTSPCRVQVRAQTENNALVEITLREGRNRQVRKMLDAVGHRVSSLRRIRFADLELDELSAGAYRILLPGEVHALRKTAEKGLQKKPRTRSPRAAAGKGATASRPRVASRDAGAKPSSTRSSGTKPAGARRNKPTTLGEKIRRQWK